MERRDWKRGAEEGGGQRAQLDSPELDSPEIVPTAISIEEEDRLDVVLFDTTSCDGTLCQMTQCPVTRELQRRSGGGEEQRAEPGLPVLLRDSGFC